MPSLLIITFQILTLFVAARSSAHDLLLVKDKIDIYIGSSLVETYELWPFQYMEHFSQNITVTGGLCYAESLSEFETYCQQTEEDLIRSWVILTPFNYFTTNEMLNNVDQYNVGALIISSDTQIDAGGTYSSPKLISLMDKSSMSSLLMYSNRQDVTVKVQHDYITNCAALYSIQDYFFMIALGYILILATWIICNWVLYTENSLILQRALIVIPIFKLIRVLIYGMYIGECPWNDQRTSRYLMMGLVTISTVYQTIFAALLLLISKGWVLLRNGLTREQATNVTLLIGTVYLVYSAYYVSMNVHGVKNFLGVAINILYIFLFAVVFNNCLHVLKILKLHYSVISSNDVYSLQETILLKISIMKKFTVLATIYFVYEILIHGIVPMLKEENEFNPIAIIIHQIFDFMLTIGILVTFRPRQWPEYFTLGILDSPLLAFGVSQLEEGEQPRQIAQLNKAHINEYKEQASMSSDYSFQSNQQVVIYNPMFDSSAELENAGAINSSCDYKSFDEEEGKIKPNQKEQSESRILRMLRSLQIGTLSRSENKPKDE